MTIDASEYDPMARAYARHWGPGFAQRVLPHLEKLVLEALPRGSAVLDLCCGTGDLAAELSDRGLDVTGLDGSLEMLRYARRRAPNVRFVHADARDFEMNDSFGAVLSVFDSLNHIGGASDLLKVFRCVRAVLEPDGVFLFDLNTELGYLERWNDTFGFTDDDMACVVRCGYDPDEKLASLDAAVFELEANGTWLRTDVRLTQRPFDVDAVSNALATAGFTDVAVMDGDADLGFGGPGRSFYLAR